MAFEVAMATETSRHVQANLIARSECLRDMLRPTYAHSTFHHSIACNETFSRPSVVACSETSGKECLQNRCGGDLAMFVATMAIWVATETSRHVQAHLIAR